MGAQLAAGLSRGANDVGKSLASLGKDMTRTGRAMTTNITLPILAAGGAVTHFALDFDTSMRRIVGLAKVPKEEIAGVRDSILKMAADVGRSPQDLAEAFYFVASAGFKADEAMKVLEIAAKGSAAGMGEVTDIAKVLGGVLNAYGHDNITAAKAGDILTAAIQDGAAEASNFAAVIGFVVPNAAALGVSFDQVTAALAAMTQVGVGADTAATNLGQVLSALQKPSAQAEKAMQGLGLSSAGLRKELREKGLLATLRTLEDRFGGDEVAAAQVFGNIRALRGVTQLLSLDTNQLNGIFADTAKALGTLQGAYDDTDGPQRRVDKAMASLQVTAIELGSDVLPTVVDVLQRVAEGLRGFGQWWTSMDAGTRKSIVSWLAWMAVIGPALIVIGKLTSGLGALFKVVGFLASAKGIPGLIATFRSVSLLSLGPLGAALAGLLLLTTQLQENFAAGVGGLDDLARGSKYSVNVIVDQVQRLQKKLKLPLGQRGFDKAFQKLQQYLFTSGRSFESWADDVEAGGARAEAAFGSVATSVGRTFGDTAAAIRESGGQSAAAAGEIPTLVARILEDGSVEVSQAAQDVADPIAEAISKAKDDAAQSVKDLISEMASTLAAGPQDIKDEVQAIADAVTDPFTRMERTLALSGALAKGAFATAFGKDDPKLGADAFNTVTDLLAQFQLVNPGLFDIGKDIPVSLQAGVNSTLAAALTWFEQNAATPFVSEFDVADQLERLGQPALAAYARGLAAAKFNTIDPVAQQMRADLHAKLNLDLYAEGANASRTFMAGFKSTAYSMATGWLNGLKRMLVGNSPPPEGPLKDLDKGAARTFGSFVTGGVGALKAGVPLFAAQLAQLATGLTLAPAGIGIGAMSMPSMRSMATAASTAVGTGAAGVAGAPGAGLSIEGGIHIAISGVGSDVSEADQRRFGEGVMDEFATRLRDQSGRVARVRTVSPS